MKKILIVIMALAMVLPVVACGGESDKPKVEDSSVAQGESKPDESKPDRPISETDESILDEPDTDSFQTSDRFIVTDEETPKESTIELNHKKPVSVAMGFIQALATGEYDVAVSALNIGDSPFVFVDDIIFGLPRSEYSSLVDFADREVYLSVDDSKVTKSSENATITVDMMSAKGGALDSYTLYLALSEDNKWLVKDNSFYLNDYYVVAAGDTTLYINDVEVGKEYSDGESGYNNLMDLYKIPAVGKAKKSFSIRCDKYEFSLDEMPTYNGAEGALGLYKKIEGEKLNEALVAVKTIWNSMYADYVGGATIAEMTKYFDESVDTEVIKTCCDGFQNLINSPSNFTDKDHHITQIQIRDGESCFYITDDVIVVNIQYQLDWVWNWSSGGAESCRRKSHILLKDTDEGYKIFYVSDGALFSDSSGNDW
ncbi:MAG: hypothetical protein IKA41_02920 [Bacteroidaceae bacterium]|nr:hypothetical protein [Bacteroidaceae bacterium]